MWPKRKNILRIDLDDPLEQKTFKFILETGMIEIDGPGAPLLYRKMKEWDLRLGFKQNDSVKKSSWRTRAKVM